ncbi:MAG: TerB family tellurite resistance protein [Pseudomonadota bacterium]|jgi:uncharacterized tellurite resistance protein B-like protein
MAKPTDNNSTPTNLADVKTESLLDQMRALQNQKSANKTKHIDVQLATAMLLVEVASSDHMIDRFEKSVIHNSLKSIFRISDENAAGLLAKARSALSSMRSSSAEASMLKDCLDMATKRAVANTIDTLIRCNGVVDSMEVYLRQRFRSLLGLPDEPLPPRSSN